MESFMLFSQVIKIKVYIYYSSKVTFEVRMCSQLYEIYRLLNKST